MEQKGVCKGRGRARCQDPWRGVRASGRLTRVSPRPREAALPAGSMSSCAGLASVPGRGARDDDDGGQAGGDREQGAYVQN